MLQYKTKRRIKIFLKILLVVIIIMMLIIGVVVWKFARNFVEPPRRALQDYHLYWLDNAQQEGLNITKLDCALGQMPCLIVTAEGFGKSGFNEIDTVTTYPMTESAAPSQSDELSISITPPNIGNRGQAVRRQLTESFHHNLTPYAVSAQRPKGIVVLLHGRAGRKEDLLPVAARLVASGFVCVLVDMPAHGDSPLISSRFGVELDAQTPNLVYQSLQDAKAWLNEQQANQHQSNQHQSNQPQFSQQRNNAGANVDNVAKIANANTKTWSADDVSTFLWGMSMGGSYANYALGGISLHDENRQDENRQGENRQKNSWDGLIIVSSFANLQGVVDKQTERQVQFLPSMGQRIFQPVLSTLFTLFVDLQGGEKPANINPAQQAVNIDIPVLEFHGDSDKVIDISQGRQLYNHYASLDKTWITVPGAGHNNVLITEAPVYATMADWLLRHTDNSDMISNSKL